MHQLPARSPAQADVVHPLAAHPSGDRQSHPADEAGRPWYPCSWRIALSKRFWQARHPPRYAAFTPPSSPSFRHSSLPSAMQRPWFVPRSPPRAGTSRRTLMGLIGSGMCLSDVTCPQPPAEHPVSRITRTAVLLSLVRAPALPPRHAYFGSQSHTPYDRCLRFGPRVAATPARLAPIPPAQLWTDQTCTGKLISASPIAPRIRLPPWMFDGKPFGWPRVQDFRFGQPSVGYCPYPVPCGLIFVATSCEGAPPDFNHMVSDRHERREVCRHRVVGEETPDQLLKP